jgi:hypothetical protein
MLKKVLPHISIIFSLLMITFVILDQYNPGMNFLGNDAFKLMLIAYGVITAVSSVITVIRSKKQEM